MKIKHTKIKVFALICVICAAVSCGVIVHAAETVPKVIITTDKTNKNAEVSLENVNIMIYSAQITLHVENTDIDYGVTADNKNMYAVITKDTENKTITLYIDSTELLDGSEKITLTSMKSSVPIKITEETADVILVDRSMRTVSYNDAVVEVLEGGLNPTPTPTKRPSNIGGGGSGGGGGSYNPGLGTVVVTNPNTSPSETAVPQNPSVSGAKFTDVDDTHWAKSSIEYVVERGLFNGVSDTEFEPNSNMTRAMYVTVLSRFGTNIDAKWQIVCDNPMHFDDVSEGTWYYDAVSWAGGTGLVSGIGDNKFAPADSVTREQIAVMTVNFAKLCGVEVPQNTERSEFTDEAEISEWAADAVHKAQQAGLLYGRDDGSFSPKDTATRAEVAAILHRFVETLN